MTAADRWDSLFPESVRILDLMGSELVDDRSDQNVDVVDGAGDARRHLSVTIPNEGSLVRRGERPRVRNATSSTRRPRFRTAAQRKAFREGRSTNVQAAAEARLAETIAYLTSSALPEPRPDMFGPCIRPTEGPAADLVGRPMAVVDTAAHCDTRILYDAATDTWTRERLASDVEGFQQWEPDGWTSEDGREWHRPDNIADIMPVTALDDTYVPEPRRNNRDLVRMANALLAGTDEAALLMP